MSFFLLENTIQLTLLDMHQCSHVIPQTIVTHNSREGFGHASLHIIHPIHRFKSSDWLKEGHMT